MQEPLSQHKVEKNEEIADEMDVAFNNIDGSYFWTETIQFSFLNIADELFVTCQEPSEYVQRHSCQKVYEQDIIETIQDLYKLKVKELNWIKR